MENKEIAKLVAAWCWKSKSTNEELAAQMFIESLVLPLDITNYSQDEIEAYIYTYLNLREEKENEEL